MEMNLISKIWEHIKYKRKYEWLTFSSITILPTHFSNASIECHTLIVFYRDRCLSGHSGYWISVKRRSLLSSNCSRNWNESELRTMAYVLFLNSFQCLRKYNSFISTYMYCLCGKNWDLYFRPTLWHVSYLNLLSTITKKE